MKKIFLLGVGAQKCGTSWLHNQLTRNRNVDMGFQKEYHVFDSLFDSSVNLFRKRLTATIEQEIKTGRIGHNNKRLTNQIRRLLFLEDTDQYFDYFDSLANADPNIELVGDMTPNYSLLSTEAFQYIKSGLEKRGFTVKVVFLMRDPIDRIWSNHRMDLRNAKRRGGQPSHYQVEGLCQSHGCKRRTDYGSTISNLRSVFSEQDIFIGYYEKLDLSPKFPPLFGRVCG